jgi:hypothetical protein
MTHFDNRFDTNRSGPILPLARPVAKSGRGPLCVLVRPPLRSRNRKLPAPIRSRGIARLATVVVLTNRPTHSSTKKKHAGPCQRAK